MFTELGKIVVPRLRELVPRGQRESGGGIHATYGPLFCPALYINMSWSTGCTTVTRLWREYSHRLRRRRPNCSRPEENTANSINRGYGIAKHCVSGRKWLRCIFLDPSKISTADLTDQILQFIIISWSCHKTLFSTRAFYRGTL